MESKGIQINIKDEIFKYLIHWKWILLSVIVALIISKFYLRYASDVYQTAAKIQILDNNTAAFKLPNDAISIFGKGKVNLENEIEIMKSTRITGEVIDKLNLTTEIYSVGKIKSVELWNNKPFTINWAIDKDSLKNKSTSLEVTITKKGYTINESTKEYSFGKTNFDAQIPFILDLKNKDFLAKREGTSYLIVLKKKKNVEQTLSKSIIIDYVGNQSEILKIALIGNNSVKINDVVNTLIEVFNNDGIQDRQMVFKKTIEFVDDRFEFLFNELDSIEGSKANYKKNNELSYVEADAGLIMQNNYESQSNLENATTQLTLSKLMVGAINKSADLELLPSNIGIESGEINALVANYNEQLLKRNKLIASGGGDSNPMVKEATNLASQLKNNIKVSIKGYQNVLEIKRNELSRIRGVEKAKYSKVPTNEKAIRSIERQQSIKETLYILLLQKREEAAVNLAITNPSVKVVDYAINLTQAISPDRKFMYLTALLIGLLLPLIVIYIYNLLDNKIHNKEDIENLLPNVSIIAEIPFIEADNKIIKYFDRSILSESFRILRTNIGYLTNENKKGETLLVTSTIKGEGKTFVSLNLAITLSTLGKKVILIGADLRNPQLHKKLNLERSNSKGVTNYLYDNTVTIDEIKVKNLNSNLKFDIIFSGAIPPNPAELLSNGRFELMLNELKNEYDYIIVDTAPTLLVTDTVLIAHLADAVLYVTRANFTEKKLTKFIATLKTLNSIKSMGIILNNVGENKGYGYKYSYNYGYGYGYNNGYSKKLTLSFKIKKWFRDSFRK